ncbi:MAG: hypothetical protein AAF662_14020 [Pseudomonadota bacterium]
METDRGLYELSFEGGDAQRRRALAVRPRHVGAGFKQHADALDVAVTARDGQRCFVVALEAVDGRTARHETLDHVEISVFTHGRERAAASAVRGHLVDQLGLGFNGFAKIVEAPGAAQADDAVESVNTAAREPP